MTLLVSVTGIDGCGKTTAIDGATKLSSSSNTIVELGKPTSYTNNQTRYEIETIFTQKVNNFISLANKQEHRGMISLSKGIQFLDQRLLLKSIYSDIKPDMIISNRDPIIDSIVYSVFYAPITKYLTMEQKISILKILSGRDLPHLLVFMDIKPELAHSRIIDRLEPNTRIDIHESLPNLHKLRGYYLNVLDYLDQHHDVKIELIDVTNKNPKQVAQKLSTIIYKEMILKSASLTPPIDG